LTPIRRFGGTRRRKAPVQKGEPIDDVPRKKKKPQKKKVKGKGERGGDLGLPCKLNPERKVPDRRHLHLRDPSRKEVPVDLVVNS